MRAISLIVGIIALVLGAIPLLNEFGVIGFNLDIYSYGGVFLSALLIVSAIMLFVDARDEMDAPQHISVFLGIAFIIIGLIPILTMIGLVNLSFVDTILAIVYVRAALLIAGGIFMIYGGFVGY